MYRDARALALALAVAATSVASADTTLVEGGKLSVAADWTGGIPTPTNPGTIAVDGIFDSNLGTTDWGRESQVAHTAGNLVGTGTNGFNPTRGVTWNMSGGSITGRFVTANASTFNMSGGVVTIRNDAGTKAIQAANDGIWNISGTFTIDAAFASTDPFIQAVAGPGTGSTYNFLSGWTGSWTHGTMSGDGWRTYVTTHPEFKLNGTPITTAIFDENFSVNNGGKTLSLLPTGPGKGPITVYLLGGQSNMTGSAYLEDLPADLHTIPELFLYVGAAPNIKTSLDDALIPLQIHSFGSQGDTMDPSIGFGERMRELSSCEKIALIKFAYNGSSLSSDWHPGANATDAANWGGKFTSFVNTVLGGLAALEAAGWEPEIKGMLWHQGEADSVNLAAANAYGANLSHFIGRVREQFAPYASSDGIRFVAGQPSATSSYPYRDTVRQAILDADEDSGAALSVANTGIVATNAVDFPNRTDNVHLNWVGALAMGRAMAYQMLDIEATTYADWALGHSLVGGIDEDDDGDGLSNRLEFALGGVPTDPSDRPLPAPGFLEIEGTNYRAWVVQRDLGAANTSIKGYYSSDLLDWKSDLPELHSCVRQANGIAVLTFRSPLPLRAGGSPRGFFRIGVE